MQESVGYQRKGLDLVNSRHNGGIASGLEVAQQAALLDSTLSQLCFGAADRARSMSMPLPCCSARQLPISTCQSRR